jgi:cysteine-rich repeat protein
MAHRRLRWSLVLAVLAFAGFSCNQFDDELESLLSVDAGADGNGGSSNRIKGADFCEPLPDVPMRDTDDLFLDVETTGLTDDFRDLSSCGMSRTLSESDTFFRVQLVAGERYHFHVKASPGQDLAVYLLSDCDDRRCVGSIDECPAGTDEHFSFVPRTAGTYVLGIDGISDGPTDVPVNFLATRPVCGDGKKQHSEVCDDGNVTASDACDDLCRAVLSDGDSEAEPNGDRHGANVLRIENGDAGIRGNLGGPCDTDFFTVRVPEGAVLRATMLSEVGNPCQDVVPVELRVLDDTLAQRGRVEGADGACPVFDSTGGGALPAGDYFVALRTRSPGAPFAYQLRIEIAVPTP